MEKFNFDIILKKLKEEKSKLPKELGNMLQQHFQANFDNQSFDGQPWQEVQRREKNEKGKYKTGKAKWKLKSGGYRAGSKAFRTNPILTKSGTLRKSIRIIQANWKTVIIGTVGKANDYAAVHNFGLKAGRGKGFTMPKRQFIGQDSKLNDLIINKIKSDIDKVLGV